MAPHSRVRLVSIFARSPRKYNSIERLQNNVESSTISLGAFESSDHHFRTIGPPDNIWRSEADFCCGWNMLF